MFATLFLPVAGLFALILMQHLESAMLSGRGHRDGRRHVPKHERPH
jgi:hypothetical protein